MYFRLIVLIFFSFKGYSQNSIIPQFHKPFNYVILNDSTLKFYFDVSHSKIFDTNCVKNSINISSDNWNDFFIEISNSNKCVEPPLGKIKYKEATKILTRKIGYKKYIIFYRRKSIISKLEILNHNNLEMTVKVLYDEIFT
jgi:hypothetical protein